MGTEVLVVGGGPVGLTTALELRRRGVEVMVIDRLLAPAPCAKAVGIQPRTVELWDAAGLARRALDAAVTMRGQLAFVDGAQTSRLEGLEGGAAPQLHHIQAVLDRLSPQPVAASNMRWSSVFRISHRLVDRYGIGRVFVAGDAAHIHPPTGAQGMNTGVQDAYNLGWKLALAVHGSAADGLLESYQAERHPVGEEVVGRTVRAARSGIGAGEPDPATVIAREAQLLVGYPAVRSYIKTIPMMV